MAEANVPLYLINGFLDSGKTTFIEDTLGMDYFADKQRTIVLRCEDGEEEYDEAQLSTRNIKILSVETQAGLSTPSLDEIDRRYQPKRILLEYNGMWPMDILREMDMPLGWGLYQVITIIDATTFSGYLKNMPSQVMDMVSEADIVLINRCTADMPLVEWKRSIRATNRNTQIVFEQEDGDDIEVEEILPYDIEQSDITIGDEDYGIWYLDVLDHPERNIGKIVHFRALVMTSPDLPKGQFIPGRNAMTCCEDDIRFFGFVCKYDNVKSLKKGHWVDVTAEVKWEHCDSYQEEGAVLYATEMKTAEAPKESLIYFR